MQVVSLGGDCRKQEESRKEGNNCNKWCLTCVGYWVGYIVTTWGFPHWRPWWKLEYPPALTSHWVRVILEGLLPNLLHSPGSSVSPQSELPPLGQRPTKQAACELWAPGRVVVASATLTFLSLLVDLILLMFPFAVQKVFNGCGLLCLCFLLLPLLLESDPKVIFKTDAKEVTYCLCFLVGIFWFQILHSKLWSTWS